MVYQVDERFVYFLAAIAFKLSSRVRAEEKNNRLKINSNEVKRTYITLKMANFCKKKSPHDFLTERKDGIIYL